MTWNHVLVLGGVFGSLLSLAPPRAAVQDRPEQAAPAPAPVRLTRDGDFKQHLAWSPDGTRLLFTRIHQGKMGLWTMDTDGSNLKPLLPGLAAPHFDGHWSTDSKKIVFVFDVLQGTDGKLQINTVQADGSENKNFIPHKAFEESPRWAPDGKSLAWVSSRDGNPEIYVVDAAGNNVKRLTSAAALDNNPSWAPDGKRLAFASSRTGNFEIFVMNADGTDPRRLTNHHALDYWPVWAPDGNRIAFTTNRDGNYEIYVMNADGSTPRNLTRHPAQDNFAAWSPDGKRLAFLSNRGGGSDVYVMEAK